MGNIGGTEVLLIGLVLVLVLVLPLVALYWLIRLAVRHGNRDAQRD